MFMYLIWKNKKGEDLRAMFEESKAILIADEMRKFGIDVVTSPEVK